MLCMLVYLRNKSNNLTRVASHIRKCTKGHYYHESAASINVRDFLRTINRPIYTPREKDYTTERLEND